ncbi:MAG: excinuclease ABC subunit UvrA, partial [Chloroflexi bacterium]|nr:excinuclease ABC subunit UvrA [Chloroflexota bacterium]
VYPERSRREPRAQGSPSPGSGRARKGGSGAVTEELVFSEKFACVNCGTSIPEVEPRTFSFNTPYGACPACTGLGTKLEVDPALVIPNPSLSIDEGAIQPWARDPTGGTWYRRMLTSLARRRGFSLALPVKSLKQEHLDLILYGNREDVVTLEYENKYGRTLEWDTTYEGVVPQLERRYKQTESDHVRAEIERYMVVTPCPTCKGARLKPESRAVTIGDRNIVEVSALSIAEAARWVDRLDGADSSGEGPVLSEREQLIARQVLKEIRARLKFLVDVGLSYLTLDRTASSLSGGEGERIRLATQIGSGLMGVLYILDEPSIGLHPVDGHRLIETLKRLRDLGNTLIIVEHDEAIMRAADWILDLGPGAGERGGQVVCTGPIERILECPDSVTGAYLSGRKSIPVPTRRRRGNGKRLTVRGARENNLKDIDVGIPLGVLVVITGVSGSGKSTLVNDILYKALAQRFYHAKDRPGAHRAIEGIEHMDKVVDIDQSPIGRTPRSNPATYTGAFTPIRDLFASVPEARARGYKPGRFSFNVKGGRCEGCAGDGYIQIEMQFLPDVTVPCEVCHGKRYNREALEVHFKGKSIAEVLDMTVGEAEAFFSAFPALKNKLQTLAEVGLGYIRLGQPATTLSGGEAQRVKLATELSRRATGRTLYILDEPTTGLSFQDVHALLNVLHRLVEAGNTVILIEHHLDLIKNADWLIDLGPEGGDAGGYVVATGTPEQVAQVKESYTGQYLQRLLTEPLALSQSKGGDGAAPELTPARGARRRRASDG